MKKIVLNKDDLNVVANIVDTAKSEGKDSELRLDDIVRDEFDATKNAVEVQHGYQFDFDESVIGNLKRLGVIAERKLEGKQREDFIALMSKINNLIYTSQVQGHKGIT